VYFGNLVTFQTHRCAAIGILGLGLGLAACSPRVIEMSPPAGPPGTMVSLRMEYLVGWPRVEVGGATMDFYQLQLLGARPERNQVPAEELVWIEDKILKFQIPDLPPGEYRVVIHDDKGPPGDRIYSFLETTAYLLFPPVWPFVLRSNQAELSLRILSP
jgi:hypothetical protein